MRRVKPLQIIIFGICLEQGGELQYKEDELAHVRRRRSRVALSGRARVQGRCSAHGGLAQAAASNEEWA